MIPIEKVQDIIVKHDNLEKELSSGNIDTKLFAKKSKEYSSLGNVILYAREFVKFELAAVFDLAGIRAPKRQCTRAEFPSIGTIQT